MSDFSARRIKVGVPSLFRGGIVIDHGIDVSGRDQKTEPWPTQPFHLVAAVPVGLRNDADGVAGVLKHTGDDGRTKAWVIHIGIANDIDKIKSVYISCLHIFF